MIAVTDASIYLIAGAWVVSLLGAYKLGRLLEAVSQSFGRSLRARREIQE